MASYYCPPRREGSSGITVSLGPWGTGGRSPRRQGHRAEPGRRRTRSGGPGGGGPRRAERGAPARGPRAQQGRAARPGDRRERPDSAKSIFFCSWRRSRQLKKIQILLMSARWYRRRTLAAAWHGGRDGLPALQGSAGPRRKWLKFALTNSNVCAILKTHNSSILDSQEHPTGQPPPVGCSFLEGFL